MVLDEKEIIELIEKGVSPQMELARKKARHRNMHVTGKGMIDYLEKLDGYETQAQKSLREKLAKSNRSNFSFILRPLDKIFTAKGGAVNYNLPNDRIEFLKDNISDVADGLDIKKYLKKKVKKEYIVDPNGVLFVDIDPNGNLETHVIPTSEILWYSAKGNKVEAIIFEPTEKKEDLKTFVNQYCKGNKKEYDGGFPNKYFYEKKYYRVIDAKSDRIFIREKKKNLETELVTELHEEKGSSIQNYFGYVPALILGDEKDNNTGLFDSIIEDLLDDADILLRRMSICNVHELAHLYPRYWAYAQACTQCEGEGTIAVKSSSDPEEYEKKVCPSCNGDGHKTRTNPSDEVVVPLPQEGDPILNKIMGYESPDLQTAKFYEELIDGSRMKMFRAAWGTTYEVGGKRETATGRYLDAQPVADRLCDPSDTFAKMHKFLLDCYGKVILRNQKYESSVTYGRRYMFEGPDDVLEKYREVSTSKVNDMTKMDMALRYIEAEYQDDPIELLKRKKLLKIEPFPSLTCEQVMSLEYLPPNEKLKKLYFAEWSNSLQDREIIFLKENQLKNKLITFINSKQLTNGTEEVQP